MNIFIFGHTIDKSYYHVLSKNVLFKKKKLVLKMYLVTTIDLKTLLSNIYLGMIFYW